MRWEEGGVVMGPPGLAQGGTWCGEEEGHTSVFG